MKLVNLQEARYHGIHPVVDFIDDVERDEIRSKTYPADQYSAIVKSITDRWGEPRGTVGSQYTYWTGADDETYCNISLSRTPDDTVMVEVSKG